MIEHNLTADTEQASQEESLDESMAALFVLITHHSLTQCEAALMNIVDRLHQLCHHSEIEHYPNQMKVLIKMRQLWRTQLFHAQLDKYLH